MGSAARPPAIPRAPEEAPAGVLSFSPSEAGEHETSVAFARLLAEERLGYIWFLKAGSQAVNYVVDDLFVQPAFRGVGLATAALAAVREFCATRGVRAMHLEVARDNASAQAVYRRAGFASTDRQLLTLRLADPTHEG